MICLIVDEENIFEYDGDDISSEDFLLTSKAHEKRDKGFPLDSISIDIKTGKYYLDIVSTGLYEKENDMSNGFKKFFQRTVLNK
jgi:8-oxo-dGTP diphosphatase